MKTAQEFAPLADVPAAPLRFNGREQPFPALESRAKLPLATALLFLAFAAAAHGQTLAQRLARWKPVPMPFHSEALSPKERQMVEKLVDACRLLNDIYWRQSDQAGLALYKSTQDERLRRLLGIMGSRWDLLDENRPFIGTDPMPPGRDFYPH